MVARSFWSAEHIAFLRANDGRLTVRELAAYLNRSTNAIDRGLVRYGGTARRVKRKGKRAVWTEAQIDMLKVGLIKDPPNVVAKRLGFSLASVMCKIRMLKLSYIRAKRPWSRSDILDLLALSEKYGHAEIALRTKRHIGSVKGKMRALGLHAFHGSYSMRGAERDTGYHHLQLMRARDALGQKWTKRHWRNRGRFVISDDQLTEMCEWLKQERWPKQQAA